MVKADECKLYEGEYYTVEWYYSESNVCDTKEFFADLSDKKQDKFLYLVKRMADSGRIFNKEQFNNEGSGLYAFKPKPNRFLCCFIKDRKIIILSAFEKKSQKLPPNEKIRAKKREADYIKRVKEHKYYEKD